MELAESGQVAVGVEPVFADGGLRVGDGDGAHWGVVEGSEGICRVRNLFLEEFGGSVGRDGHGDGLGLDQLASLGCIVRELEQARLLVLGELGQFPGHPHVVFELIRDGIRQHLQALPKRSDGLPRGFGRQSRVPLLGRAVLLLLH